MEQFMGKNPRTQLVLIFFSVPISFLFRFCNCTDPALVFDSYYCTDSVLYNSSSTYKSNLNTLLYSFSSYANSTSNNAYRYATVGQSSNTVYGSYYCRGDDTSDVCRNCVNAAVLKIAQLCPNMIVAYIWYDQCTLRYSDKSFFSTLSTSPGFAWINSQNITNPTQFNQLLGDTINQVATIAAYNSNRFATEEVQYTSFMNLYCLAQCSPDLSVIDCNICLQSNINYLPTCCSGKQGGRVVNPSCTVRFEIYPFYQITPSAPPPPPAIVAPPIFGTPPPPPSNSDTIPASPSPAIVAPPTFATPPPPPSNSDTIPASPSPAIVAPPTFATPPPSPSNSGTIPESPSPANVAPHIFATPPPSPSNNGTIAVSPSPAPTLSNSSTIVGKKGTSSKKIVVGAIVAFIVPIAATGVILSSVFLYCALIRKKKKQDPSNENGEKIRENIYENAIKSVESLQFNFMTVLAATNSFATYNKIGEGGFGAVSKGILPNGQEIAVKWLSVNSGQGREEFKNEVVLLAKLQHRNLVKLLGYCLEEEEKILIYEFVNGKSLDYFLFADVEQNVQLDWPRRYNIIGGIARGLLYLHEDSRLGIIHRDLKARNVLLDEEMNPKISDFGMARIFGLDQTQANTNRVGTFGYMAPEYALHGQFSIKSDVFSFGVLVLEILSGKKNSIFCQPDFAENLISSAWRHWNEGTAIEFIDPIMRENCSQWEAMRCIHMGLLCVQEEVADRPTMASIVLMLNSYSITMPIPTKCAFFGQSRMESDTNIEVNEIQEVESD